MQYIFWGPFLHPSRAFATFFLGRATFYMGLFTKAVYNSFVNAAYTRKVTVVVDGENVERSYSFVERAIRLNRIREGETEAQFVVNQ